MAATIDGDRIPVSLRRAGDPEVGAVSIMKRPMKVELTYVVNGTTKTAKFECASCEAQILDSGVGNIRFRDGLDEQGNAVESITVAHPEVILRRA